MILNWLPAPPPPPSRDRDSGTELVPVRFLFDFYSVAPQNDPETAKERHKLRLTALRALAQVKIDCSASRFVCVVGVGVLSHDLYVSITMICVFLCP